MTTALPVASLVLALAVQAPAPPATRTVPEAPVNEPVVVRGCLEGGRRFRVLEHDSTDLSGVRTLRLKAPRGLLQMLDDAHARRVELTGRLDFGRRDRLDARKRWKPDRKTTVSLGASAEQVRSEEAVGDAAPVLHVEAFTPLDGACTGR